MTWFFFLIALFLLAACSRLVTASKIPLKGGLLILTIVTCSTGCFSSNEEGEAESGEQATQPANDPETKRSLAKSCDTTYDFDKDPELFTGYMGYLIPGNFENDAYLDKQGKFRKTNWSISTYKQTGNNSFEKDRSARVPIYQKVHILKLHITDNRGFWFGYATVETPESDKPFVVNISNITMKDIAQCSLIQKAKNRIATAAMYIPPEDDSRKPVRELRQSEWVDMPDEAAIVVTGYDVSSQKIKARVFDTRTRELVCAALFEPETLTEMK